MRSLTVCLGLLLVPVCTVSAKTYPLPDQHGQITISDEWHEVTKPDELVSVKNDNSDSFTVKVTQAGRVIDVQKSGMGGKIKTNLIANGCTIDKDGPFQFQGQPAIFINCNKTVGTTKVCIYVIVVSVGNDVFQMTLIGDTDPSQNPKFQAILNSFVFTPAAAASPTAPPSAAPSPTPANSPSASSTNAP